MSGKKSSGIYVIDSSFNIVSFNEPMKEKYPLIRKNEKCFKALMNGDEPCTFCPVVNNIKGPRMYTDPLRHVKETIDAIDLPLSDGGMGYALVFNNVLDELNMEHVSYSKRRKLLVCESSEENRELLRSLLSDEYDILEAADEEEAFKLLNTHYRDLSLVLLDLGLPEGGSYRMMNRIRDDAMLQPVPIIVTTEATDMDEEEKCLQMGAVDFLLKPIHPVIAKQRIKNIITVRESTSFLSVSEIDELTGLYTREAFFRYAQRLIDTSPDAEFDMFIVDIEAFRNVNEKYGEQVGDHVLKALADFIRKKTPDGICARLNSDLFAVIRQANAADDKGKAQEMMLEFAEQAPVPNLVLKNGIYENIDKTLPVSQMCDRAMLALKSIKHKHSRQVALYDGPASQELQRSQGYESIFRNAIEQKEFEVHYQPKYEPYTGEIVGAEALVRWTHDGKVMYPGDFLPVFETNGMISNLDEYVFREVCEFQRKRREAGNEPVPISVNISRESMFDNDVPQRYRKIAEENGVSPADVPIEITESAAVGGVEIKPIADAFNEAGFSLHIDDFGSGRSSLNDLNVLSIDVVKLDRSLISCIGEKRGSLLLAHTIALGRALGLKLIAEGVEDEEQLNFLKENGCDYIQGYYYSRPLPEAEFEKKVSKTR